VNRSGYYADKGDVAFAEHLWDNRPTQNARVTDAATQAWVAAGADDKVVALFLYNDVA